MDMRIYCLKCKIKTDTSNITETRTNNNRKLIIGTCSNCGNEKSVFVSAQNHATVHGSGFSLNSFMNNRPVEYINLLRKVKMFLEVRSMINKNIRSVVQVQDENRE